MSAAGHKKPHEHAGRHWTPALTELDARVDGLGVDDVRDETKAVVARVHTPPRKHEYAVRPIVPPITHSSIYKMESPQHFVDVLQEGGQVYSRLSNPTCDEVEAAVNLMEGGAGSIVYGSGSAAIALALMTFLKSGDHVVVCHPLYSGTFNIITKFLQVRYKIEVSFVGYDVEEYRRAVRPNTKVLYGETPCNPMLNVLDLEALGKLGQSLKGVVTMVDSTYGSPYLQKPIKHGIDLSIHSGTKYLGGHSDICAGVVTARTVDQWRDLWLFKEVYGSVLSPFEASLMLRGIRTLHLRMDRACDNAQRLAEWLQSHPQVEHVAYPGLPSDPGHLVAKRQMRKFGAMISFIVKGGFEPAKSLIQNVRVIQLAVSLGGTESLISHPASMTHGEWIMSNEEREEAGISAGLVRFSAGIEHVDDLIADLRQAFARYRTSKL